MGLYIQPVTVPNFMLSIIRKTYVTGLLKNRLNNKLTVSRKLTSTAMYICMHICSHMCLFIPSICDIYCLVIIQIICKYK
jgi:hypothetical protein